MSDTHPKLVALVAKPRVGDTIDSLSREGVYDDTRRITEHDETQVAIPISEHPIETSVNEVTRLELSRRVTGLSDLLKERGFSESVIRSAPASWAVLGSVVLADFDGCTEREAVADALLELHGEADTVLHRNGIDGAYRIPDVEFVAGAGETETVHVEHGIKYALNLSYVMFSPGNKAERVRMGEVVDPDERVFDMFAGIGYFTLPMAASGADVTAAEVNPEAYRLLVENAVLNDVEDRVEPVLGDCRTVETNADRVVMGYYDAPEYLDAGISALEPGGILHLHEATPEPLFPDRPIDRFNEALEDHGRAGEVLGDRIVKTHSEGVVHGVIDVRIEY